MPTSTRPSRGRTARCRSTRGPWKTDRSATARGSPRARSWTGADLGRVVQVDGGLRDALEVRPAQEIPQAGPGAGGIDIGGATPLPDVVDVHGAEVDAEAGDLGRVRNGRMQLRPREEGRTTLGRQEAHVGLGLHRLLRLRLRPGIGLDLLRGGEAALGVPAAVVVGSRPVLERLLPVARMEGHRVA